MKGETITSAVCSRRQFMEKGARGLAVLSAAAFFAPSAWAMGGKSKPSAIVRPPLPYPEDGLEPVISARTISFHYGKHHQGYVDKTNRLIAGTRYEGMPLEKIIRESAGTDQGIFNNAAQVYNHTFYWNSLKPGGGGPPTGRVAEMIKRDFGSHDAFVKAFADTASSQFGSGWGWLVADNGRLSVEKTSNADTPIAHGKTPLLTIDVWEHAYYLDYQNRRADYIRACLDKLVNWDWANRQLG